MIPARDAARFLPAAIASVQAQTFTDWELIVVDDGDSSADHTVGLVWRAMEADPRIVFKFNWPRRGIASALNTGVRVARAPLIARLDADDRMLPTRLERQVAYLGAHPEIGVLGTAWLEDLDGGMVSREIRGQGPPPPGMKHRRRACIPPQEDAVIRRQLRRRNPMGHPTVMFRRHLWQAAGGYDESLPLAQDWALWRALASRTRFANLVEPLTIRGMHAGQASQRTWLRRWCQARVRWRAWRAA